MGYCDKRVFIQRITDPSISCEISVKVVTVFDKLWSGFCKKKKKKTPHKERLVVLSPHVFTPV